MVLKMKPICDCGHIFNRIEVKRNNINDGFLFIQSDRAASIRSSVLRVENT